MFLSQIDDGNTRQLWAMPYRGCEMIFKVHAHGSRYLWNLRNFQRSFVIKNFVKTMRQLSPKKRLLSWRE